jgi:hypothetical protein
MGTLGVDRNVYTATRQAIADKKVTPAEAQKVRQEMEASGTIEAPERQVLNNLASRSTFTVANGRQNTPIDPSTLSFPTPSASLTGQSIGRAGGGSVTLGDRKGSYSTEKQAIQEARKLYGVMDDPDAAVVQNKKGDYDVYLINRPGRFSSDGTDFSSYNDIRSASLTHPGTGGERLVAVVSEDNKVRYQGRESSPRNYAQMPPLSPISPANASAEVRAANLADQKATTAKTLDRLKQMESDLGSQKDHRGVFAGMYRVITERGIADMNRLEAQGDIRGAEFTGTLINNFANRYFEAYDAYAAGDMQNVPEVWRSAFDSGRNSEAAGYPGAAITEVVSLSMTAHILNDLPQTLKDIGYTTATDRDPKLQAVFDTFNGALMEEKGRIMGAIGKNYGNTDMHMLDKLASTLLSPTLPTIPIRVPGEAINNGAQREAFTIMRTMARERAMTLSNSQIRSDALGISDTLRPLIPGGN